VHTTLIIGTNDECTPLKKTNKGPSRSPKRMDSTPEGVDEEIVL
jgi:hypothetical protein